MLLLTTGVPTIARAQGEPPEAPWLSGPATDADGTYTISWTPTATPGITWYELQERVGTGSWITVYSGNLRVLTFSKAVVASYSYRVAACSQLFGCSAWSNTISVNVTGGITQPAIQGAVDAVGSIPYGIDAASDGDAVIGVPLHLIPGVADFGPSLSLEYDSGRGIDRLERSLPEDTLGYGWRLAGLSEIRRCVVNQASSASIQLTNGDSLCLDGMPLVLASGTHFSVGAIYRTLIESYIKVQVKGAAGALWFEATLPDGTLREYGNTGGSRVDHNNGVDFQWSMNKETSTDGNVIDYSYWFDPSKGINRIALIDYTDATINFEYLDRTDATGVAIGSATQTQAVFLHTIRVNYAGTKVREYRLLNELVSNRRRLNLVQLCGYDENGGSESCLAPLDFDWLTPGSTMAGVPILVDGMLDGLGAVHQIEYGTITGSSHPFLFTERPYGNGTLPPDTQLLSGTGALRHVVTKLHRENGLGGLHETSYAYQDKGIKSTKHRGFLGFYAQRVTDAASGAVTYVQYRMDYPFAGQVARLHRYDANYPSQTQTLVRAENDYAQQSISHGTNSTVYPYAAHSVDFIYSGAAHLGVTTTTNVLTFASGLVSKVVTTARAGTGVSAGTPGSTWGDIPTYTASGLRNTTRSTVTFTNRTTSGKWLIGFPNAVTTESWLGAISGAGLVQDVTLSPDSDSLRPAAIWQFPNDTYLTRQTNFIYDSRGRRTSASVSGDNATSRSTVVLNFVHDRYPGQVRNALFHTTTYSEYDLRFGTVKVKGDPNGRHTEWVRDHFGRVLSVTNADGVVTSHAYSDCSTGCSAVYGLMPAYKVKTTTIRASTTIAPVQTTYYDTLGRVVRAETQAFAGSSTNKRDFLYDTQGRVHKYSLPYLSGREDVVLTYDLQDRVTNLVRPDGGSTGTVYSVSGSTLVATVIDNILNAAGASDGTQVKRNEYNILGQLTKTTDGYGTAIDPYTTYSYDANGNLRTAAVSDGVTTTTTTYEYDAADNRKEVVDPNSGTTTMAYTGLGDLWTLTDAKGQLSTYTHDALGRLETIVNPDGTSTWEWDTAANGKGKLASRSNPGFFETYTYNGEGRLSSAVTNITPIGGGTATNYTTSHTYDAHGRPSTTTYPGGFVLTRAYNARGYLSQLKEGSTAIQTFSSLDAFGNSIDESYANGVRTVRAFDPETGRLTDVDTTKSATVLQNNVYGWRSNGTLEHKTANPAIGLNTTRKESYVYDVLNRVSSAQTYINGVSARTLSYGYTDFGNLTSNTSTLPGDTDVTGYGYGAGNAGPHAVSSASINGVLNTLTYDLNGAVTRYDIGGTVDDRYLSYNADNQPKKIVIGSSLTDTTPVAKDEFAYDPNGQRYARRTVWQEGASTYTETVAYIGPVEVISDNSGGSLQTITKTRLSPNVMHVKVQGTGTVDFFEYAHFDHLGSIEAVTDEAGNALDQLAYEPYGSRKTKDWTGNIPAAELDALLDMSSVHSRKARGFTRHEHLDRTGLIHMNGRVYDPVLGRFLSPDPIVQYPGFSQGWNKYAYVNNTPTSFIDPRGFDIVEDLDVDSGPSFDAWFAGYSFGMALENYRSLLAQSAIRESGVGGGSGARAGRYSYLNELSGDSEDSGWTGYANACNFFNVECESELTNSGLQVTLTMTARLIYGRTELGNTVGVSQALRSIQSTQHKNQKISTKEVFAVSAIVGGTFAAGGAIAGALYAIHELPLAFAAAGSVSGGFLIGAAGVADVGVLAGVGAMTVGAPVFLGTVILVGAGAIAWNYWIDYQQ